MLEAALAGAVAGYAIAVPVGAIAVLVIHTALTNGLRQGLAAATGAATADLIYATVAALAGAGVAAFIGPLVAPLRVVGGLALVGIGVYGLLTAWQSRDRDTGAHLPAHRAHGRTYLAVLGLTLLNPATVIYFAALTVGLPFLGDISERLVFAGAAFVASLSWQWLLAIFGAALGRGAGHRLRLPTALFGNVIVIILGLLVLAGTLSPGAAS
ncbi:MAG TPA: LysE family transporter [Candidatus Limnocylindria bacterium]|nr:LysE family transporter [Candidatus Limnocylindria bacterium]